MHIVHVSADFPDAIDPGKTPVIKRLVDLASGPLEHTVFSLNRTAPSLASFAVGAAHSDLRLRVDSKQTDFGHALQYHAPGRGILHATMLRKLGTYLAEKIALGVKPDLIVGHKLTIEGIAVRKAAQILEVPFAVTIQGNTDTKVLATRPDLKREYAAIFHQASHVFAFAPWALERVVAVLGPRPGSTEILPCPTGFDTMLVPNPRGGGLLSVFHLHNARGKNLRAMAKAMRLLAGRGVATTLDVVGGGTHEEVAASQKMIGAQSAIRLVGAHERGELRDRMNAAAGFVLPSRRESFGLVFVEALLAGLPIVYPKGAAVDGYFDGLPFAIPVNARSTADIAAGMARLVTEQGALKSALAEWQAGGGADRFLDRAIATQFSEGLSRAAIRIQ